jgi:hypothetical protein
MLNAVIIIAALLLACYLAFSKRLATSANWKAKDLPQRPVRLASFAFLAVMCLLVFALGLPSE